MTVLSAIGLEAGKQILDQVTKSGNKSTEFLITMAGLALIAGGGVADWYGHEMPLSFYAGVVAIVVPYVISRIWIKDQAAAILKSTTTGAMALLLASCAGVVATDSRYQLAKGCEVYARSLAVAEQAVSSGRTTATQRQLLLAAVDEASPICEDQTTATTAGALDAVERAILSIETILREVE